MNELNLNTNKALILVDYQKEWTDESSDYFVGDILEVVNRTNKLIDFCRKQGYKIIFIRHIEKESNKVFAKNSKNVELIDKLHKESSDCLITKYKISPFYETDLEKQLEGFKEIVVSGILSNLCVRSLIHDAYDRDFKIKVIKDCCVSFDTETQNFTFKDIKATREEIDFVNLIDFVK